MNKYNNPMIELKTAALVLGATAAAIKIYDYAEDYFQGMNPEKYIEQMKEKVQQSFVAEEIKENDDIVYELQRGNDEMVLSAPQPKFQW